MTRAKVCPTDCESSAASGDGANTVNEGSGPQLKGQMSRDVRVFAFADIESIKVRARSRFNRKPAPYNVQNEYWKTGISQKIAKSQRFENVTLGVIVINAMWIAIDTDHNDAFTMLDASWEFVLADIIFFGYFSVELIIRFSAFQRKRRCLRDPWFVFDSCLVALYFFDPFIMTFAAAVTGGSLDLPTSVFFLLRLFRLLRLTRLVRMMRSLPELMIMIKGMLTAAASVSYTMGLLMIVTYIFAIALAQLSIGNSFREQYFQGVALSMYTLLIYGTLLDSLAGFTDAVREESTICLIVVTIFAIISALTLMNMLIGVLCEIVSAIASTEKETLLTDKVHETCCKVIEDIDSPICAQKLVSFEEMKILFQNKDAQGALQAASINIHDLVDVSEDLILRDGNDDGQVTFDEFMNMVLDCRASKQASLKDVMVLRRRISCRFRDFKVEMRGAESKINALIAKRKDKNAKLLAANTSSPKHGNEANRSSPKHGDEPSGSSPKHGDEPSDYVAGTGSATPMFHPDSQEQYAHEAEAGHELLLGCTGSTES